MSPNVYSYGYRLPRYRTDFHLLVQSEDRRSGPLDGRCCDISEDGLCAQLPAQLEVGSTITLIFTLPGSSHSLRLAARVRHRRRDFYGFAFLFASQKERDAVRSCVESLRADTVVSPKPSR